MPKIQIRVELCQKCGQCVDICPEQLFKQVKGAAPRAARPSACISCGHCISICPAGAVAHSDFPSDIWKQPVKSRIGYHIRPGGQAVTAFDCECFLGFAKRYLYQ